MELPEKQAEAVYWRPGQTQRHMRAPRELDRPVLVDATLSPEGRGRASWRVFCLRAAADLIAALREFFGEIARPAILERVRSELSQANSLVEMEMIINMALYGHLPARPYGVPMEDPDE